jgi:diadenosine tetraphosphate (Ap4A) HIT family hydrolase
MTVTEGRAWSSDWYQWKTGEGCPFCHQGRPDEINIGVRFFAGEVLDAYLLNGDNAFGSTMLIWRGRHITDPIDMDDDELCAYWLEARLVGRALDAHYSPIKLTYLTVGAHIPHLHTAIVLRYDDDGAPNALLTWSRKTTPHSGEEMRSEAAALRRVVDGLRT